MYGYGREGGQNFPADWIWRDRKASEGIKGFSLISKKKSRSGWVGSDTVALRCLLDILLGMLSRRFYT